MGSVVVSVDAELGWGFHDHQSPPVDRVESGRTGWRRLVELFDRFRVPATWAVVGHLYLEDCDGRHEDHPTPPDWFARERTTWSDRPDVRFGRDLIDDLLDADVDHDVGCHTFSHVVFEEPWVDREVVAAELDAAADAAATKDVDHRSFVFPRNAVGHRDVLADHGFEVYRGELGIPPSGLRHKFEKFASAVDPEQARIVEPYVDEHGLVDVPPSMFLFGMEGLPRTVVESIWIDPVVARARRGIERATAEDGVFHMWLHPNNLLGEPEVERMAAILELVDRYRRESSLEVETMADVADRFR